MSRLETQRPTELSLFSGNNPLHFSAALSPNLFDQYLLLFLGEVRSQTLDRADRGLTSLQHGKKLRMLLYRPRGIELISPHRSNRKKTPTQDGRPLRRYARRWIVERTNVWLQNFRRLVVRYERSALIFLGLIHMACALIALKRVIG